MWVDTLVLRVVVMIGIDYDANAIAHREVSRKISELEQELIELKKAYIGV